MVEVNGQKYLDGAEADSIPLTFCQQLGFDKIIVILTRPADYQKTPSMPWLAKCVYRHYPNLVHTMQNRHHHYNQTLAEIHRSEKQGEIFVIRPSQKIAIKRLENNPQKIQAMYDLGVADALTQIAALKGYLGVK
jgi:predicted patatin/cPLA2 family phospholipase